jgi:hypothetical protein
MAVDDDHTISDTDAEVGRPDFNCAATLLTGRARWRFNGCDTVTDAYPSGYQ